MVSFKFIVLIFALLFASFVVQAKRSESHDCGHHEHFERCGKPISCQPSCKKSDGRVCHAACVPACMCNGGRVRSKHDKCVRPRECRRGHGSF